MYLSASADAENGATSLICRNAPESRVAPCSLRMTGPFWENAGRTARQLVPRSFSSCALVWIWRFICSRAKADIIPRPNPQMAASAIVSVTFGELGERGGDATVTTRASVEGNDCCCTD